MAQEWKLGQTSAKYETRDGWAGAISSGKGDYGGVSYGTYQFSSKSGGVQEFLKSSVYADDFSGLKPATPEFDVKWKELARSDPEFGKAQHEFVKHKYYDVQRAELESRGISLSGRGPAVQDALWSTSVQFRNLTPGIFETGLKEKYGAGCKLSALSDRQIVEAVQDYKIKHNNELFKSSPEWWPGLLKRARNEKVELIELTNDTIVWREGKEPGSDRSQRNQAAMSADGFTDSLLRRGDKGSGVERLQGALASLGYTGKDGKPLVVDRVFGPDTEHALRTFQRTHGIAIDGKAGPETQRTLVHALQHPIVSEATHPAYGLYAAIGAKLPSGTNPKIIANVTLNAVENGIASAAVLKSVEVSADGKTAFLRGTNEACRTRVDLQAPPLELQQSSDHLQMHASQPHVAIPTQGQAISI